MRKILAVFAIMALSPAYAGTSALIKQYDALDVKCRGGHGDDPATLRACDKREAVGKKLEKRCTYIPSPHPTGWDCK
jgi:hypothetical protein